ncbi:MAG: cytochrome c [Flavipsychrobacter sp.]|nr:cytochrome c [Flavipsychrobacter sp.]
MKKLLLLGIIGISVAACGGGGNKEEEKNPYQMEGATKEAEAAANPSYDPERGVGKFTKVDVPATLDKAMAGNGKKAYEVKCSSCHKLTDEKLVGPGWAGVTSRHKAEWIMNFVTNPDEMLDKDPKAQAQLEICLVRMPNQNLSDDDARSLYEFMRENDGVK